MSSHSSRKVALGLNHILSWWMPATLNPESASIHNRALIMSLIIQIEAIASCTASWRFTLNH